MTILREPSRAPELTFVAHAVGAFGGMENQLRHLAQGCLDDGRKVTLITRRHDLGDHPLLTTVTVPGPSRPMSLGGPWFAAASGALLRAKRRGLVHACGGIVPNHIDVVGIHFCHASFNTELAGSRARNNRVDYRLNALACRSINLLQEAWSLAPSRVGAVVAVSNGLADEVARYYPAVTDKVLEIPNGVDSARFRPDAAARAAARRRWGLTDKDLVALFVGGDWDRKGLSHAIHAVAEAHEWHLVVAGHGDVPRFRAMASRLGVTDRVKFAGFNSAIEEAYAGADLFVLPSLYEACPLVVLEAAAAALPILVTPVNGPVEYLSEGESGLFLSHDPRATAVLLSRLASDRARREELGTAARAVAVQFSWERCVQAHLDLYDALWRRRTRPGADREPVRVI